MFTEGHTSSFYCLHFQVTDFLILIIFCWFFKMLHSWRNSSEILTISVFWLLSDSSSWKVYWSMSECWITVHTVSPNIFNYKLIDVLQAKSLIITLLTPEQQSGPGPPQTPGARTPHAKLSGPGSLFPCHPTGPRWHCLNWPELSPSPTQTGHSLIGSQAPHLCKRWTKNILA